MDLRKVDALVAEHVIGWLNVHLDTSQPVYRDVWVGSPSDDKGGPRWIPSYSSSWDAAGQVVEQMQQKHGFGDGHGFMIMNTGGEDGWYCEFPRPLWEFANAPTMPLAVCLAALNALSVKVPE